MSNFPPKDVTPADLWAQITEMPRPHRVVDLPRRRADGKPVARVAIAPLTQQQSMLATASTERFVRKMLKDEGGSLPLNGETSFGYSTLFENRASVEILFRACKREDDLEKPFFPAIEQIAHVLTTDEIGVMMRHYAMVQCELGPIVASMSEDEVNAWIERLATGGSALPLSTLSVGAQSQLLISMAERLWTSMTDKSLPGSPPDETT